MAKKKNSRSRSIAPILRATTKRQRGIPFKPGNRIGAATRFAPGNCANPGGRPKSEELSKALRTFLSMDLVELRTFIPRTAAEQIALGAIAEAAKRKLGFIAEVCDRAEGKARVVADVNVSDPLSDLILEIRKMHEQLGPPEAPGGFKEENPNNEASD